MAEVNIGSLVRVTWPLPGYPPIQVFEVVDKDDCHWHLIVARPYGTKVYKVPFKNVYPIEGRVYE